VVTPSSTSRFATQALRLCGPPKTGKSAGAASAPGHILYLNADLPNALRFARSRDTEQRIYEVEFEGLQTLIDIAHALKQKPTWDTVVVDPLGELYRRLLEDLSNRSMRPSLPTYGDVGTHMERFCRMLCEAPVNAVFVAHEIPVKDEATDSVERLPSTGTKNPALGQKVMGMVDIVGSTVMFEKDGENVYAAQLINARGARGGDRFDVLGNWRALNLTEWFEIAKQGPTAQTAPAEEQKETA
jgi:adenosyl cobinamide kinase/adenosyl cobinamide phosphate guanylyltransferase